MQDIKLKAKEAVEKAEKAVKELTYLKEQHKQELETLTTKKHEIEKNLGEKDNQIKSLSDEFKLKEGELSKALADLSNLQKEKTSLDDTISKLNTTHQTEVQDLNKGITAKDGTIAQSKSKIDELTSQHKDHDEKVKQLQLQIDALKEQVDKSSDHDTQVKDLKKQLDDLKEAKEKLASDHKNELQNKETKIHEHHSTIEQLQKDLADIKIKLEEEAKTTIDELKKEKEDPKSKAEENSVQEDKHKKKLAELERELTRTKASLNSLETKTTDDAREANEILNAITTERDGLLVQIGQLTAQHKDTTANLQTSIAAKDSEIEGLNTRLKEHMDKLEDQLKKHQKLLTERDELLSQITKPEDQTQMADLQSKLSQAEENLEKERNQMKTKLEEVDKTLKEVISGLRVTLLTKEKEIESLAAELLTLKSSNGSAEKTPAVISEPKTEIDETKAIEELDTTAVLKEKSSKLKEELKALKLVIESKKGKKKAKGKEEDKSKLESLEAQIKDIDEQIANNDKTKASDIPKFEILKAPESVKVESIPAEGDVPVEIQKVKKVEDSLEEELKGQERLIGQWRLYLEKVFSHISLLDAEMKEKNHDLEAIAEQVANTEALKDCQVAIIEVLKRTIAGIVRIGQDTGVKTEHEVAMLVKDIKTIRESSSNKKESKASSAREIALHEVKPEIIVHEADPSPDDYTRVNKDEIEAEKAKLSELSKSLGNAITTFDKSKYEILRAKLLEEKLTDHLALLVSGIKDYSKKLVEIKDHIKDDENAVKNLTEAKKALAEVLHTGDDSLKQKTQEVITDLQTAEKKDDLPASTTDVTSVKTHDHKHAHENTHETLAPSPPDDQVDKMNEQLRLVDEDKSKLEKELEAKKSEKDAIEKKLDSIKIQIDGLKQQVAAISKLNENHNLEVNQKEKELASIRDELNQKTSEKEEVEKKIASIQSQLTDHNSQIENTSKLIDNHKLAVDQKEKELTSLIEELKHKKSEANKLETAQTDLTSKIEEQRSKASEVHEDHNKATESDRYEGMASSSNKKHFSRQQTVEKEHAAVTVTPSPDDPQDDVIPVDSKIIEDLIVKIKADLEKQHKQAADYHKLKADYDKLLLTHQKLEENIGRHKVDFDEMIEKLKTLNKNLEVDHSNLKVRDELAAQLKVCIDTAGKLRDTSKKVATLESVADNLAEQLSKLDKIDKLQKELAHKDQEKEEVMKHIAEMIRKLAVIAQQGSIGQVKAICYMSDLPAVNMSQDISERYKLIQTNLDSNLELLEDMWTKISSGRNLQEDVIQYAEKVFELEGSNLNSLDSLLDNIYENLTTRRSTRQSPESIKH